MTFNKIRCPCWDFDHLTIDRLFNLMFFGDSLATYFWLWIAMMKPKDLGRNLDIWKRKGNFFVSFVKLLLIWYWNMRHSLLKVNARYKNPLKYPNIIKHPRLVFITHKILVSMTTEVIMSDHCYIINLWFPLW